MDGGQGGVPGDDEPDHRAAPAAAAPDAGARPPPPPRRRLLRQGHRRLPQRGAPQRAHDLGRLNTGTGILKQEEGVPKPPKNYTFGTS